MINNFHSPSEFGIQGKSSIEPSSAKSSMLEKRVQNKQTIVLLNTPNNNKRQYERVKTIEDVLVFTPIVKKFISKSNQISYVTEEHSFKKVIDQSDLINGEFDKTSLQDDISKKHGFQKIADRKGKQIKEDKNDGNIKKLRSPKW